MPRAELTGLLFDWTVERTERAYRVVVVEPSFIEPATHSAIFNAAISTLLATSNPVVSDLRPNVPVADRFDLVTFPEAFLPADDFIKAIKSLAQLDRLGCVHVGLRPDLTDGHLFDNVSVRRLIAELKSISKVELDDLAGFISWIDRQDDEKSFNLGCLFTIDTRARIRVCLHPKMVRSRVEARALPEDDMAQGDLISLVTLVPSDPNLFSITMQPLICSDVLQLDSDRPGHLPIDAVNTSADRFQNRIPDYVDVVTVATCTPQSEIAIEGQSKNRMWHQQFRESFIRSASHASCQRHAHAAFVLANFWSLGAPEHLEANDKGGLSGIFLPVKVQGEVDPDVLQLSTFGRSEGEFDNGWSLPSGAVQEKRSVRGYLAQLPPYGEDLPLTRMLRITVNRLPRHASPWGATVGPRDVRLHRAESSDPQEFRFRESRSGDGR